MRDSTTCTGEKGVWLMPAYVKEVPYMPVSKMDFSSANTKHNKFVEKQVVPCASLPSSVTSSKLNIPETSNEEQLNFLTTLLSV